jgi:hypothetical protein
MNDKSTLAKLRAITAMNRRTPEREVNRKILPHLRKQAELGESSAKYELGNTTSQEFCDKVIKILERNHQLTIEWPYKHRCVNTIKISWY